jgi:hypothetical protein
MDAHTKKRILDYLLAGNILTSYDGFEKLGTTCAKDYVSMLRRKDGVNIKDEWRIGSSGKRYKIYYIEKGIDNSVKV